MTNKSSVNFYPNPTNGIIFFKDSFSTLEVYNSNGQMVKK